MAAKLDDIGVGGKLTDFGIRAANRLSYFQVLKCVTITEPAAEYLDSGKYECRFLSGAELTAFAADPANKMPLGFVHEALAKGDECYGILDGGKLASYGWYAVSETEIEDGGLAIRFDRGWVYMYKGYTKPEYRGQRLHAIGMTRSLKEYRERGIKGIVSYVAANNFASLKSCYRMGYKDFGSVAIGRVAGKFRIWHSPGCRTYGLRVVTTQ